MENIIGFIMVGPFHTYQQHIFGTIIGLIKHMYMHTIHTCTIEDYRVVHILGEVSAAVLPSV